MKKLLLLSILFCSIAKAQLVPPLYSVISTAVSSAHANGYLYARTITIDPTKVGASDLSNFPVLVSGTFSYLATIANGGSVNNTTTFNGQTVPADVIFTSDLAGTTLLSWDYASYTASTGQSEIWIKFSTLHHSSADVIYMWYGKSSVTTFQGGSIGSAYDANAKIVQHLPNGSTLTANDATANANNGTLGGSPTPVAGQIDGAASFNGTSQYITTSSSSPITSPTGDWTIEAWVKPSSLSQDGSVFYNTIGGIALNIGAYNGGGGGDAPTYVGSNVRGLFEGVAWVVSSYTISSTSTWYHVVFRRSSGTNSFFVNGSPVAAVSNGTATPSTSTFNSGFDGISRERPYAGGVDEVRVSNTARSSDWILTEYNNQGSPSTFYTIGSAF